MSKSTQPPPPAVVPTADPWVISDGPGAPETSSRRETTSGSPVVPSSRTHNVIRETKKFEAGTIDWAIQWLASTG